MASEQEVEIVTNALMHLPIKGAALQLAARQVLLALEQAAIPPSGETDEWVMVPREPTKEMRMAIATADWQGSSDLNWDDGYRIMLAAAPPAPVAIDEATHRHKKRGTDYVLIGIGKMQADDWYDRDGGWTTTSVDMREVAIYRSADDGSIWVRPREEFEDGRFEYLNPQPNGGA